MMALQRRLNENMLVPANAPYFQNGVDVTLFSQAMYVDSAAMDVKLPVTIEKAITKLGCIIEGKRLIAPAVCNAWIGDAGLSYPVTTPQLFGPYLWSSIGFTPNHFQQYPYPNNMSNPVANTPSTALVPVNAVLDRLIVNTPMVNVYAGYDSNNRILYPFFLGGPWLQLIRKLFDSFGMTCNPINTETKNFTSPESKITGGHAQMGSETELRQSDANIINLMPNNLQQSGPNGNPLSFLSLGHMPVNSASSNAALDPASTAETLVNALVDRSDQTPNVTVPQAQSKNLRFFALFTQITPPAAVNPNSAGAFNVKPITGLSVSSALDHISAEAIDPDSTFAKLKTKVDEARSHIPRSVRVVDQQKIDRLTTDHAYKEVMNAASSSLFGTQHPMLNIGSSSLGKEGKGMPNAAASTFAVVTSTEGITAADVKDDQDEPPTVTAKKVKHKKLKKIGKDLKKVAQKSGEAVMSTLKGAGEIADQLGKTSLAVSTLL